MRYAILSDIHANLEALQAVLQDAKQQGCAHTVCLGDIVGYNANPKECLDAIRSLNIPCVKGNYDEYCSSDIPLSDFAPQVIGNVKWTKEQLTNDDQTWLRSLNYVEEVAGFTIVHATLDQPSRWEYVFDKLAAACSFQHQTTTVCFFGHTHVPFVFIKDKMVQGKTFSEIEIKHRKQYFINAGSVGHPRDGNPGAAYVIYDLARARVELRRVRYDKPPNPGGSSISPERRPISPVSPKNGVVSRSTPEE